MSATDAQVNAKLVLNRLRKLRSDDTLFEEFWISVVEAANNASIAVPSENSAQAGDKRPRRETEQHPQTRKNRYKSAYAEALDYVICQMIDRFEQPDYKMYAIMENIILQGMQGEISKVKEEAKKEVKLCGCTTNCECERLTLQQLYKDDFTISSLLNQFGIIDYATSPELHNNKEPKDINTCIKTLRQIVASEKKGGLFPDVLYLAKLLLLAPASNASSERIFSKLRLVKNYLRSTMNQDRLESLMALSVHKKELDNADLVRVSNDFVERKPKLRAIDFGEFSNADRF